jgi:hypothetical protein
VTDQLPVTLVGAAVDDPPPHAVKMMSEANTAIIADCLRMTDNFIVLPFGLGTPARRINPPIAPELSFGSELQGSK